MRIEICDHKNQTIYYDEDTDKFVCDIEFNDNTKSTKRLSLSDVKKEIDLFIKTNANFKPFKFIELEYDRYPKVVEVQSIRTDSKIVLSRGGFHKDYKSLKDLLKLQPKQLDKDILDNVSKLESELELFRQSINEKIKEELSKLKPLDISELIPNLD